MNARFPDTNAELIAILALVFSVVTMASIALGTMDQAGQWAAGIQAFGSVAAISAALWIAHRQATERDRKDDGRHRAMQRALAIQFSQEVQQKKDAVAKLLQAEIFPQTIDFRWHIPTFLEHGKSFKDYVELGDGFMRIAAQLRNLDKDKQDHASGLSKEDEVFASASETLWRKKHVTAVLIELVKLDALLVAARDDK